MPSLFRTSIATGSVFFVICGLAIAAPPVRPGSKSGSVSSTAPVKPPAETLPEFTSKAPVHAHQGPWGDLEWTVTYLEPPSEILNDLRKPETNPHWTFPNGDEKSIRALFTSAGLAADLQQRLLDPKRMLVQGGLFTLFPTPADLESLKPHARQVIYSDLAKYPGNEYHHMPFIITGSPDDWLRDTLLRPQLQDIIRKTVYRSGNALAFSDLRLLLTYAVSDEEVDHIFKTVARTRTLIGALKISPGSDGAQLLSYWAGGQPESEIQPLLQAALERTGGASLDITHLLPPLPRRRLYTYPTPDLVARGRYPDAHWTALNFFTSSPQDPTLVVRPDDNSVLETYDPVDVPYHLGDMICLQNEKGEAVHSCIYIADNVVFTKNGASSTTPWVLLPLQEVKDYFSSQSTGAIKAYRRRWNTATPAVAP